MPSRRKAVNKKRHRQQTSSSSVPVSLRLFTRLFYHMQEIFAMLLFRPLWRSVARPAAACAPLCPAAASPVFPASPAALCAYENGSSSSIPSGIFIKP